MNIKKDRVVDMLRSRGDHDKAQQAECALPRHVDTDVDAGLLHTFDVHISELSVEADGEH